MNLLVITNLSIILILLHLYAVASTRASNGNKEPEVRQRKSKDIIDKVSKLDEATKKRVLAMKASGMPKEAIAEKISYTAGNKHTAAKMVDAIEDESRIKSATNNAQKKIDQQVKKKVKAANDGRQKVINQNMKFAQNKKKMNSARQEL
eukprot:gene4297-6093_t